MKGKKGFTLVELIIVVVIIGILASITVPAVWRYIEKARKSEAVAALGAIKMAERLFASQNASYSYASIGRGDFKYTDLVNNPLADYLTGFDLNGQFFDVNCYGVNASGTSFVAYASPTHSTAPGASKINGYSTITMDQDGTISNY